MPDRRYPVRKVKHRCPQCQKETVIIDPPDPVGLDVFFAECSDCIRKRLIPEDGGDFLSGCVHCESPGTFKPSHMGIVSCRSGSLASGGTMAHCTCDSCF
jgi:hypothetical protein